MSDDNEHARAIAISDEGLRHLLDLYRSIWTEAVYDPDNAETQTFARKLLPSIKALNKELRFKP